jgi:hypothetical protein
MRKHWNVYIILYTILLKYDPFNKQLIDEYRERKWKILLDESSNSEDYDEENEEPQEEEEVVPQEEVQEVELPIHRNAKLQELRERIR